jgi:predicted aconitase with swiveling domain
VGPGPHAVVTSDAEDVCRIAAMIGVLPTIVKA